MVERNPNLRSVPNPPNDNSEIKDLVKTVALTSAVSTVVGVFALAGGQWIYRLIKRAVVRKDKASAPKPTRAQMDEYYAEQGYVPAQPHPEPPMYYEEQIPEALRTRPHLRTGGRRRRPGPEAAAASTGLDEFRQMLTDFEKRQEDRFSDMQRRIDDMFEEEDDDEEEEEDDE